MVPTKPAAKACRFNLSRSAMAADLNRQFGPPLGAFPSETEQRSISGAHISARPVKRRENEKDKQFKFSKWSEREDLNLRPLVSQTSALTGLRHAPMPFP